MGRKMRNGNGTFSGGTWRVRKQGLGDVQKSPRQLSGIFGVDVPKSEAGSKPYWLRYLADLRFAQEIARRSLAECSDSLIGNTVVDFKMTPQPQMSAYALTGFKIGHVGTLTTPRATPKRGPMLRAEIASWVESRKAKGHKGWLEHRRYCGIFAECVGSDIPLSEITVEHYRTFFDRLATEFESDRTRRNARQLVDQFLRNCEADHNGLRFGFVGNSKYRIDVADPEIRQWTPEEIKTALATATGAARFVILAGLNFGANLVDLYEEFNDKNKDGSLRWDGERIVSVRGKHLWKKTQKLGEWKAWPETVEAMQWGLTESQLRTAFNRWRKSSGLAQDISPKGLRSASSQWIFDNFGDEAMRLYRGEKVSGVAGRSYIRLSDAQRGKLDTVLAAYHAHLFGQ